MIFRAVSGSFRVGFYEEFSAYKILCYLKRRIAHSSRISANVDYISFAFFQKADILSEFVNDLRAVKIKQFDHRNVIGGHGNNYVLRAETLRKRLGRLNRKIGIHQIARLVHFKRKLTLVRNNGNSFIRAEIKHQRTLDTVKAIEKRFGKLVPIERVHIFFDIFRDRQSLYMRYFREKQPLLGRCRKQEFPVRVNYAKRHAPARKQLIRHYNTGVTVTKQSVKTNKQTIKLKVILCRCNKR